MRSLLSVILLTASLFFYSPSFAQQDTISLNTIVDKSNKVADAFPIEKVYLHFDKPYYAITDTIWFKGYVTYLFNDPSQLGKILYVDIINSRDILVESLMLPLKDGTATGSIVLTKDVYTQDSYHIRAYTKWMSNFDPGYFFNKTITIGDAINKSVSPIINLKQAVKDNLTEVTASIIYRDAEGKPYANKKVDWYVSVGYEDIAKGKDNTGKDGSLTVTFVNKKNADLEKATLHATLETGGKENYNHDISLKTIASTADVQFFPEGGNFINNIPSKVAIKAIQSNGLSIGFTAVIIDNEGKTITNTSSKHAGMGSFELTPLAGKNYKAAVTFADGTKQTYDLPKAQSNGISMSVNNTDTSRIQIRLTTDSTYFKAHKNQTFYIIGKSGQIICYAAKANLSSLSFSAALPTAKFPTGIVQITLLTAAGQPLSERLVFVKHNNYLNLGIATAKTVYPNRQQIKLNISSKTTLAPAEGDLSVTVIDETRVPFDENSETTILSSLLLTSDLKGYIEAPSYYFRAANKDADEKLDLLMLTQGYRRFTYREIIRDRLKPAAFLPEQGIEISGTLNTLTGTPVKGGTITLQIPDKYFSTNTTTDKEGRFTFTNLAFVDSARVVVSAKGNYNAKNLMVRVDGMTYPGLSKNPNYPDEKLNIDTVMGEYLVNSKKIFNSSRLLQEVVIQGKAITKPAASHTDYPSLTGLSSIDKRIITGEMLSACANLLVCLQGMVAGVTYDNSTNEFYVSRDYNAGGRVPMAIYANGMPVDANYMAGVRPADVENIEVFLKDDLGLVNRAGQSKGVLSISTKKAPVGTKISLKELEDMLPQPNIAKLTPKGYHIAKLFYSPKYGVTGGSFGADLRTTIYWNPKVITDATGKASVEFFSGDNKGTYKAVVEGFDKNGHIGRAVYRFKVQ